MENDHEAIVSPAVFDMVQTEIAKRKKEITRYSGVSIFSNKIKCGDCGGWYGCKVWHSGDKYRKVIYQCNHKFKGDKKCGTPHVTENEIKEWFVIAVNKLLADKNEIIQNLERIKEALCDTAKMKKEQEHLQERVALAVENMQSYISQNARAPLNQEQYEKKYSSMSEEYETLKAKCDNLSEEISSNEAKAARLEHFIKALEQADSLITEFDDRLWSGLMGYIMVRDKEDIRFMFKDGTEIQI